MLFDRKLEDLVRRVAKRLGLRAVKARGREHANNLGGFMLVDISTNTVFAGSNFDLVPEEALKICLVGSAPTHGEV